MPQTLKRTFQQKMNSINRLGVSKKETCEELGVKVSPYIHGASTFDQYCGIASHYADFCEETDPTASTLRYCFNQGYARAFVQAQIDAGLSPSTIARTTCALAKLHSVSCPEIHDSRPKKRYADYTRARHYDEDAYAKDATRTDERGATTRFLRACGIREFELIHLYGNCLITDKNGNLVLLITRDTCYTIGEKGKTCAAKGGRERRITIQPAHEQIVREYVGRVKPDELVCPEVSDKLCIHGIRARFAMDEYKRVAADLDTIRCETVPSQKDPAKPVGRIYRTRDGKGRQFDRLALRIVAQQLGHTRENVCVESYLWDI